MSHGKSATGSVESEMMSGKGAQTASGFTAGASGGETVGVPTFDPGGLIGANPEASAGAPAVSVVGVWKDAVGSTASPA